MTFEEQVAELRREYAKIEKLDPSLPIYENLCNALDMLETDKLEMLAAADIRWLSVLANNRVIRRKMGLR